MQAKGYSSVIKYLNECHEGWKYKEGYMLRYIKIIQKGQEKYRNYPVIPYNKINEIGARMYKGEKVI